MGPKQNKNTILTPPPTQKNPILEVNASNKIHPWWSCGNTISVSCEGWGCFPQMPPNIWECCWKDQSHLVTPPISLFLPNLPFNPTHWQTDITFFSFSSSKCISRSPSCTITPISIPPWAPFLFNQSVKYEPAEIRLVRKTVYLYNVQYCSLLSGFCRINWSSQATKH